MIRVLTICAVLACALPAAAGVMRVAIVVGNNTGNGDQPPLHFAESDAEKFAGVLTELGGVAPADVFLLEGKDLRAVTDAFARARRRIADLRSDPENRIVVMFYFSGHSDGEAIELGRDRLPFAELRRWLANEGADVRVALVDSCKSGALLDAKGGKPAAAFQIRLTDSLESSGEALITSSAADEVALESREIRGSFFTHHFISGLRGAADTSGDGVVTLGEAYRYAYAHTIKTTGETLIGPQHPSYDYRLSGQGELVLAELTKPTAAIVVPSGFDRVLVVDVAHDQVIAEVGSDARGAIAVQPGSYVVRAWRGHAISSGTIRVAAAERRVVRDGELSTTAAPLTTSKLDDGMHPAAASAFFAAGVETSLSEGSTALPGVRAEIVSPRGISIATVAGSQALPLVRETSTFLMFGGRGTIVHGDWSAFAGGELGGGLVVQTGRAPMRSTGAFAAGAVVGGRLALSPQLSVELEVSLLAAELRRDDAFASVQQLSSWLGLGVTL
jgi:hypothetical protein